MHQPSLLPLRVARRHAAPRRGLNRFCLIALCCAAAWLASATTSFSQVVVTPTVTFDLGTGVYTYSYSVFNGASQTLAIVSFGAMPTGTMTVQNLNAPMGFLATYDSGNGFVSFLEDNNPATLQTFAPGSTTTPFTFTSTFAPGTTAFQALDTMGNSYTGLTVAPVPEPTALLLCALALPGLFFLLHSRRKLKPVTVS